MAKKIADTP